MNIVERPEIEEMTTKVWYVGLNRFDSLREAQAFVDAINERSKVKPFGQQVAENLLVRFLLGTGMLICSFKIGPLLVKGPDQTVRLAAFIVLILFAINNEWARGYARALEDFKKAKNP